MTWWTRAPKTRLHLQADGSIVATARVGTRVLRVIGGAGRGREVAVELRKWLDWERPLAR